MTIDLNKYYITKTNFFELEILIGKPQKFNSNEGKYIYTINGWSCSQELETYFKTDVKVREATKLEVLLYA